MEVTQRFEGLNEEVREGFGEDIVERFALAQAVAALAALADRLRGAVRRRRALRRRRVPARDGDDVGQSGRCEGVVDLRCDRASHSERLEILEGADRLLDSSIGIDLELAIAAGVGPGKGERPGGVVLEMIQDRLRGASAERERVIEALEAALRVGQGRVTVYPPAFEFDA